MLLSCDDAWFGGWRGPSVLRLAGGRLSYEGPLAGASADRCPGGDNSDSVGTGGNSSASVGARLASSGTGIDTATDSGSGTASGTGSGSGTATGSGTDTDTASGTDAATGTGTAAGTYAETGTAAGTGTAANTAEAHFSGTVLAPFTDSHVHLGLIDPTQLIGGGIGRVVDLGWDPRIAATWLATGANDSTWPEVSIAGGLLGPTGGYPSRSAWAPPAAALAVDDAETAATTIDGLREAGASVVKITLNSDVGPVWSDDLLAAVVSVAHDRGLPVVAHAQGIGQARRAARARVDALAHTPFSERLDDDLLDDIAPSMTWISTLDIHGHGRYGREYEIAVDNLTRFQTRGGKVLYGTDLGNGPLPVGLNGRELASLLRAGLDLTAILEALTPGSGEPTFDTRVVMILEGPRPTADEDPRRLGDATAVTLPDLVRRSE